MTDMTDFEREAIRTALERMFRPDGYLDITTLDDLAKLARIVVPERTRSVLRAVHCVHWREMRPAFRDEIANTIVALFALPEFVVRFDKPRATLPVRVVHPDTTPEKRSLIRRLMGS
jgi:hypothetical protein